MLLRSLNLELDFKVEVDEMQSFVEKKANQRWLWQAIDHYTGEVLAYVLGSRTDEMFLNSFDWVC